MDEKTCERCGTQYTPGVIDACPGCGAPAGRIGGSSQVAAADEPAAPPEVWEPARRGGGGGAGPTAAWVGTLVLIAIAGGAVWFAFGGGDGDRGGDGALTTQTNVDSSPPTGATAETETSPATTVTDPPETSAVPRGGASPLVTIAPLRAQDRGCLARWNAKRNRALRRKAFSAATGGRRVGAVQLVPPGQPTVPLHCVVLVGVQARAATSATPGRIYAETRPFSAAPSRWIRLETAFLSYQWNARMRAGGRLDAARR